MTHFFYRQKRQLVRESPLLPLIKDVEAKERERKLLLLHDPPSTCLHSLSQILLIHSLLLLQ